MSPAGPTDGVTVVADGIARGDRRPLARAISWIEADDRRGAEVLARLRAEDVPQPLARWTGVTGPPGSGKSTLVDRLIGAYREAGLRVAVVAVDPSSPHGGGAILGDRVRMTRWYADPGVFVRSMATRGQLGGLAAAALRTAALLEAAGYERIVLETVGVGQSEIDVATAADATVLVLAPGAGDGVQMIKAGVLDVADLYALNKSDQSGAERLRTELLRARGWAARPEGAWNPPLVTLRADRGEGIPELVRELDAHDRWRGAREDDEARRDRRAAAELAAAVRAVAGRALRDASAAIVADLRDGRITAERAAARLLSDAVPSEP